MAGDEEAGPFGRVQSEEHVVMESAADIRARLEEDKARMAGERVIASDGVEKQRIAYQGKVTIRLHDGSQVGGHLFHRTDYHEDGSQNEWYGIEVASEAVLASIKARSKQPVTVR
jgi:hypothetical protein